MITLNLIRKESVRTLQIEQRLNRYSLLKNLFLYNFSVRLFYNIVKVKSLQSQIKINSYRVHMRKSIVFCALIVSIIIVSLMMSATNVQALNKNGPLPIPGDLIPHPTTKDAQHPPNNHHDEKSSVPKVKKQPCLS